MPAWLPILSTVSLLLAGGCALRVVLDLLASHPQRMWIMNVVWPVTTLFAGPVGLLASHRSGRPSAKGASPVDRGEEGSERPLWQTVADAFLIAVPLSLFGHGIFAAWGLDFVVAFLIGIAFQYFSIQPMRDLSPGEGLRAALEADGLSPTHGRSECTAGWPSPPSSSAGTSSKRRSQSSGS